MDLVQTCGFTIDIKQALKWILLISSFHGTICGQNALPSFQDSDRPCSSNHQCIQSIGEICWWSYDGCSHGQCMCDPRSHYFTTLGKCGQVKLGGQQCRPGVSCPLRMECKSGRCTCQKGTRMTDDARFCLKERERMFGETCNPVTDVCYLNMATGYHTSLVTCLSKKCRCKPGYKPEGGTCRKLMISEGYCDQNHHCQGGALCKGKLCICPAGYFPGAGNTKCIKAGAQFDLGLGAECDEVNEQRYCALGLVCHQCPRDSHYTCVAYRKSETYNSAFIGSGHRNSPTILCALLTSLSIAFSILKISHWF